ncbi:MAG: N-acetylmuramoyl-L-alanine amidase [Defluviitaleaceae bacterium]|nr:N-acetylmuramoyl-L-alanine amidase [Defluviitaleaceae bacterium]
MEKYRGTRGVRNYIREAEELKKPAKILAIVSVITTMLAFVLIAYSEIAAPRYVAAAVLVDFTEFSEYSGLIGSLDLQDYSALERLPIVPLHWGAGIFFDTYTNKIILPPDVGNFEIERNYYRRLHTIAFEDVEFSAGSFGFALLNIFPLRIAHENNSITIRTRRGALLEYGESYVQIIDPRERYHTIVVIDPGHGGRDPGAPSTLGANAPYEAEIVLAISRKLFEIFDEPGVLLIPTRTCDYFMSTTQRVLIANIIGDYFISIHCNANSQSSIPRGTISLYGSAYGSRELAEHFQDALVSSLGSQNRGVEYAPRFHILRNSQIPVVLLELLFQSNPYDAARLANPEVQLLIAQTLADSIRTLPPARY